MTAPSVAASVPFAEISFKLPWLPYSFAVVPESAQARFQVANGCSERTATTQSASRVAWATSPETSFAVGGTMTVLPKLCPSALMAFSIGGTKICAPSITTALIFLHPSSTARLTCPTPYIGWLPIGNECLLVNSDGAIAQHTPNQVMFDSAITGIMLSPK